MGQLGSGNNSHYPRRIDTRQIFRNSALAAPDSDTRLDSEVINDNLDATIKVQQTLGADPQGLYGSLAARLNQFIPGGGIPVTSEAFGTSLLWALPGTRHHLGTPAILLYAYNNSDPALALDPGAITVDPSTFDILATFGAPQAGLLVATLGEPSYTTTFTDETSFTILGTTHQLATADVCCQVRDTNGQVITGAISIHPTSFDVTLAFGQEQSGRVIIGVPGNVSSTPFTGQTTVTIFGTTHNLDTRALCWQVWDAATPETNSIEPASVSVDPDTFDITFDFGQSQDGRIVLGNAIGATGVDFQVRDGGTPNQSAVRVYSQNGNLHLQHGTGNNTVVHSKSGTTLLTVSDTGQLGLGATPTHQLHLSTDDAAKLATATWATTSDERLKDVLRPYEDGLSLLAALEPVWYRYNGLGGVRKDGKEYVGLLAQAVQRIAPYMVTSRRGQLREGEPETDILELHSHSLIFAAINAINTLAQERTALLDLLTTLQTQVTQLTTDLAAVKAQLAPEESH